MWWVQDLKPLHNVTYSSVFYRVLSSLQIEPYVLHRSHSIALERIVGVLRNDTVIRSSIKREITMLLVHGVRSYIPSGRILTLSYFPVERKRALKIFNAPWPQPQPQIAAATAMRGRRRATALLVETPAVASAAAAAAPCSPNEQPHRSLRQNSPSVSVLNQLPSVL